MIDLRSDTVTRPSPGMREAMFKAEVGDDVFGEDPSIVALQQKVAELLGKEAALFLPSGVMANQLGVLVHTSPGTEVVLDRRCHIFNYEGAAPAWLASVQLCPVESAQGLPSAEKVRAALRAGKYGQPPTSLICLENTHNLAGGIPFSVEQLKRIADLAHEYSLPVHLDGARLWNASVALGVPVAHFAHLFDTVAVCLSKGLGAPVGSLLVGTEEHIRKAHTFRKRLGGGMRQSGILAAAGMYALEHNFERLAKDHSNAYNLAQGLTNIPLFAVDVSSVQTNIVYFDVVGSHSIEEILETMKEDQILMVQTGPRTIRAVTHLDVTSEDINHTVQVLHRRFGSSVFTT